MAAERYEMGVITREQTDGILPRIDAARDGDWSLDQVLEVGERLWDRERQFKRSYV